MQQQFREEEDRDQPIEETEPLGEEGEQDFELIYYVRQLLQGPRAWVLLAVFGGTILGALFQTGLIWPLLFVLIMGGAVFFHVTKQPMVIAPDQQEEHMAEVQQKQRVGMFAQIETLDDIQLLTGRQFEILVADLMEHMGYTDVKVVGRSRDLGVDIKATGPKGEQIAVQCKRYVARKKIVSRDMQAFYGMVQHHGAHKGMYVTTSSYTKDARQLAEEHEIELIDGVSLIKIINGLFLDFV